MSPEGKKRTASFLLAAYQKTCAMSMSPTIEKKEEEVKRGSCDITCTKGKEERGSGRSVSKKGCGTGRESPLVSEPRK